MMDSIALSRIPLMPPPEGLTSNFVDPPTQAGTLIGLTIFLILFSTTFVLLRLYTRIVLLRKFGTTDCLLLAGYGFAVANSATALAREPRGSLLCSNRLALDIETSFGLGRHGWDIPLSFIWPHGARYTWWQIKFYILSIGFSKLAILGLYLHLSPSRNFRISAWILVILVACLMVATFFWSLLSCIPISNSWSFEALVVQGRCRGNGLIGPAFNGATTIATDLALLILPMIMLRNVKLPRKKKIGVIVVLSTGALASIISVIRMVVSIRIFTSPDPGFAAFKIGLWSAAELHSVVVCACLPILRPFARRFFPSMLGTSAEEISTEPSTPSIQDGVLEIDHNGRRSVRKPGSTYQASRHTKTQNIRLATGEEFMISDRNFVSITGGKERNTVEDDGYGV